MSSPLDSLPQKTHQYTVKEYVPISFLHPQGSWFATKRLLSEGLPDFGSGNWKTFTFTVDHEDYIERFADDAPIEAYKALNGQVSHLMKALNKAGYEIPAYINKLELHKPYKGLVFPHWHVLVYCPQFVDRFELQRLQMNYGFGPHTWVEKIDPNKWDYYFKYIRKDWQGELPEWFLGLTRPQIMRKSNGFYPTLAALGERVIEWQKVETHYNWGERSTRKKREDKKTIGERLNRWSRMVAIVAITGFITNTELDGTYHDSMVDALFNAPKNKAFLTKTITIKDKETLYDYVRRNKSKGAKEAIEHLWHTGPWAGNQLRS